MQGKATIGKVRRPCPRVILSAKYPRRRHVQLVRPCARRAAARRGNRRQGQACRTHLHGGLRRRRGPPGRGAMRRRPPACPPSASSACPTRRCPRRANGCAPRFRRCPSRCPSKRITVNLSPADLPKEGSHFDLPIAAGPAGRTGDHPARRGRSDGRLGRIVAGRPADRGGRRPARRHGRRRTRTAPCSAPRPAGPRPPGSAPPRCLPPPRWTRWCATTPASAA